MQLSETNTSNPNHSNNSITSPSQTQEFKFVFTTQQNHLIIQLSNQHDTMQYIGSISAHPNIDFDLIQDILQQNQFTVLIRNENIMKLKVGPLILNLDCKFKLKTQKLQNHIDKLLQSKHQLQTFVKKLKKQCQTLKNIPKQTGQVLLVQPPIRWCQKFKSDAIKINQRFVTKKQKSELYDFALLQVNLSQKYEFKQKWAIKIKYKTGEIMVGVCLKNVVQNTNFNDRAINWTQTGHGCYGLNSSGWCFSHQLNDVNNQQRSFKFNIGDVIFIEYDKNNGHLRFYLNEDDGDFKMVIPNPPSNDAYHPFVALARQNSTAQLMLPGQPTNETFLSRFIRKFFIDL